MAATYSFALVSSVVVEQRHPLSKLSLGLMGLAAGISRRGIGFCVSMMFPLLIAQHYERFHITTFIRIANLMPSNWTGEATHAASSEGAAGGVT